MGNDQFKQFKGKKVASAIIVGILVAAMVIGMLAYAF